MAPTTASCVDIEPAYEVWRDASPGGSLPFESRRVFARKLLRCETLNGHTQAWVRARLGEPDGSAEDDPNGPTWTYDMGVVLPADFYVQCKLLIQYGFDRHVRAGRLDSCDA